MRAINISKHKLYIYTHTRIYKFPQFVCLHIVVYNQRQATEIYQNKLRLSLYYFKCLQLNSCVWLFLSEKCRYCTENWNFSYYLVLLLSEKISTLRIGNLSYPVFESVFGLVNYKISHLKAIQQLYICSNYIFKLVLKLRTNFRDYKDVFTYLMFLHE